MKKKKNQNRKLILASASPRRREYFRQLGYPFRVATPRTQEQPRRGEDAAEYVLRNAQEKAMDVARRVSPEAVIVAADTVVVLRGKIMEKPQSARGARTMLRALSGQVHQVITGFCVYEPARRGPLKSWAQAVVTDVEFKKLSDAEIKAYIESGEPMDKAGAYGAQGLGALLVERIDGDFFNVMGLPLCRLAQMLKKQGVVIL